MAEEDGHESLLWENNSWGFSNSDNSGENHEKLKQKVSGSNLNSQIAVGVEKEATKKMRGRGGTKKGGGGGGESDHEIHIWTERERRKKMRNMFANLHVLLPQLPPKVDKSTIVDEAANYIKTLEQTVEKLQKQKMEKLQGDTNYDQSTITPQKLAFESREAFLADRGSSSNIAFAGNIAFNSSLSVRQYPPMFQTWSSSNVVLNISGDKAHFCVCSQRKSGLLSTICYVLEKHKIEVLSAHISSDFSQITYMIQGHVSVASNQLPEAFSTDEIYKQAAGEIMFWVSS